MSHVSIISRGSLLSTPERTLVGCSVPPIIQMGAPHECFLVLTKKTEVDWVVGRVVADKPISSSHSATVSGPFASTNATIGPLLMYAIIELKSGLP